MAERGCVTLSAQNITDGTVTVTPTPSPAKGFAKVTFTLQILNREILREELRKAEVSGADLVVTLRPKDKAGQELCWESYA